MRWARRLFPLAVFLLLATASALLAVHKLISPSPIYSTWFETLVNGAAFGALATVVLRHRPASRMGWTFAALSLIASVQLPAGEYAAFATGVHPLPAATSAALIAELPTAFVMPLVVVILLLYPDGEPLTARWRPVLWVIVATSFVESVTTLLHPGVLDGLPGYANPLGVAALSRPIGSIDEWATRIEVSCLVAAMVGVGLRYRRGGGVVKAQVKWFLLAVGLFIVMAMADLGAGRRLPVWVPHVAFGLGLVGFAVATGFAILRHRLYDVDRIVSRTLAYAVVSGLLVTAYVGVVTSVTRLTPTSNGLAVAAATLVTAALFQPLRRRVQRVVDRRFNRTKYDAERTIDDFSRRLRGEVDLDSLRTDLLAVIGSTMQPTAAGLWLRESPPVPR